MAAYAHLIRIAVLSLAAISVAGVAAAQKRGFTQAGVGAALPAAGLSMTFHDNANCPPISSPYGSPTRYDGSMRQVGGGPDATHGGIDLTLREGTPLLAIAPGTVFAMGEGGRMEGNYIWLLHRPAESGLPYTFLVKYQHLQSVPRSRRGDPVARGQEIARSGLSGTTGGHYGSTGYAHLHLTIRWVPDDKAALVEQTGEAFAIARDSIQIDPLTLYVPDLRSPPEVLELPVERRKIVVGHVDSRGLVRPATARLIWPVACL